MKGFEKMKNKIKLNIKKYVAVITLFILGLFLFPASAFADSDYTIEEMVATGTVNSSTLNVRSGPGKDYDSLGSLSEGDTINVTGQADTGWYEIDYGGTKGYVSDSYVTVELTLSDPSVEVSVDSSGMATVPENFNAGSESEDGDTGLTTTKLVPMIVIAGIIIIIITLIIFAVTGHDDDDDDSSYEYDDDDLDDDYDDDYTTHRKKKSSSRQTPPKSSSKQSKSKRPAPKKSVSHSSGDRPSRPASRPVEDRSRKTASRSIDEKSGKPASHPVENIPSRPASRSVENIPSRPASHTIDDRPQQSVSAAKPILHEEDYQVHIDPIYFDDDVKAPVDAFVQGGKSQEAINRELAEAAAKLAELQAEMERLKNNQ